MPQPTYSPHAPLSTPPSFLGTDDSFHPAKLTEVARSFELVEPGNLEFLFPDRMIVEREIEIIQVLSRPTMAPVVEPGVPIAASTPKDRVFSNTFRPLYTRDSNYIEQYVLNQLRSWDNPNVMVSAVEKISSMMDKLIRRQTMLKDYLRVQAITGGINHYDPRSTVSIEVPMNIPSHNYWSYKGWNAVLAQGTSITYQNLVSDRALINDKGRNEAAFFVSLDGRFGVPWTDKNARVAHALSMIRTRSKVANKTDFDTIIMSDNMYSFITLFNEELSVLNNQVGYITYNTNATTKALESTNVSGQAPVNVTFSNGELTHIAGMRIVRMSSYYEDPLSQEIKLMWPDHRIVMVSSTNQTNKEPIGRTDYPVGESPLGTSGIWSISSDTTTHLALPGRGITIGNCFLPYLKYPHFSVVVDVCEPDGLAPLGLSNELNYGLTGI